MLKNLLVLGDSYALLDDNHGHWASMWADVNNINITHMGYPGAGHVHIINKFLEKQILLEKYDTIFYSVTDFLRADVTAKKNKLEQIDTILTYYDGMPWEPMNKSLSDISIKELAHASPNLLNRLKTISQEDQDWYAETFNYTGEEVEERIDIMIKNMEGFYNSMLTQWITRANLFALETLILKCREKDINLVLVMWPGVEMHKDNFDGAQVFNCTNFDYNDDKNDSRNHLTKYNHKKLLVKFTKEIKNGDIRI